MVRRYHEQPTDELYDLANDPFELVIVVGDPDPDRARTVVELRGRLDAWRVQQGERLDFAPMPEDAKRGELIIASEPSPSAAPGDEAATRASADYRSSPLSTRIARSSDLEARARTTGSGPMPVERS